MWSLIIPTLSHPFTITSYRAENNRHGWLGVKYNVIHFYFLYWVKPFIFLISTVTTFSGEHDKENINNNNKNQIIAAFSLETDFLTNSSVGISFIQIHNTASTT